MKVRCPYCGAEYEAPDYAQYLVCPYCGTVLREGKVFESVYIFEPRLDKTAAFNKALSFKPWASPRDLATSAAPSGAELHFVPLYLYYVYFEPLKELATYATALALEKPQFYIPEEYQFPARWRTAFKPSLERRAVFHQPQLNPDKAWERASKKYLREARDYASAFKTAVTDKTSFEGIVYYPFWVLKYSYKGKEYSAVVDAAEGDVVYMEYPVSGRGRAASLAIAGIILGGSALIGAILGLGMSYSNLASLYPSGELALASLGGALVGGIAGSAGVLRYAVERKAVYRQGQAVELL